MSFAGSLRQNEPAILRGLSMLTFRDEFGSSMPVRFLDPSYVSVTDSAGNTVEHPKCDKCGQHMATIVGKEALKDICLGCQDA